VITTLPHGTTIERRADGWVRRDRDGGVQAELRWAGDRLAALTVTGYDPRALRVDGAVAAHPVLGATHALTVDGVEVARMSAIDWRRPAAIPAIDRPGALPPGTGTMLLDTIARLARDAGVPALRYAGPYPTAALWAALAASFRADGDEATFTADAAARWRGGALPAIAIDFAPAPHERARIAADAFVARRDRIERLVLGGAGFERGGGVRRLVDDDDGVAAEFVFGDRAWARLARLGPDGALRSRAAPPPVAGAPAGEVLPPALVAALIEVIADALPPPLTADMLRAVPIVWGDAGLAAARDRGDQVIVHVGLWHHLAPRGLARVALALAEALTPIAAARAVAALAGAVAGGAAG